MSNRPALLGVLPDGTGAFKTYVPLPEVKPPLSSCIFCATATPLVPEPQAHRGLPSTDVAQVLTYDGGVVDAELHRRVCPSCQTVYSSCWAFWGDAVFVAADPRLCSHFQFHTRVRKTDLCFADVKYMKFLNANLLHAHAPFESFQNILDVVFEQRPMNPQNFRQRVIEHAWFHFNAVCILWDAFGAKVSEFPWVLTEKGNESLQFLNDKESILCHGFRTCWGNHRCSLCDG